MLNAVAEELTAALRIASSIPARSEYFYGLQIIVPGLCVCARRQSTGKRTDDTVTNVINLYKK